MNDNFSKNLRKLRLEKKLTQEQVAEKLGVSARFPLRNAEACKAKMEKKE